MANFEVSKRIPISKEVTQEQVAVFIKERLDLVCKYKMLNESPNNFSIKGRVLERFFTPVTKFTANIKFKITDEGLRIHIVGASSANWVFWTLFVIGIFTVVVLIVDFALIISQKKKPQIFFESVLGSLDAEFGTVN
ncbi:hypothetical protein [Maridesulfovibrio ferrireducens]|uniref:hypothetical protein n=1 Tax=Maridesulfovibrio ferrireducens TaxID=246191 RepID=UPI001A1FCEEE|nr:hypothetical protein [Maridesulfovibrio ferrireducens]MBI9109953.1 hypothetical protein [Maridesulfovibrio ferrireducens]